MSSNVENYIVKIGKKYKGKTLKEISSSQRGLDWMDWVMGWTGKRSTSSETYIKVASFLASMTANDSGNRNVMTYKDYDPGFDLSSYQRDALAALKEGGSFAVKATAGAGKSTFVEICANSITGGKALAVTFMKHNTEELSEKLPANVHVSTLHSVMYRVLNKNTRMKVFGDGDKAKKIAKKIFKYHDQSGNEQIDWQMVALTKRVLSAAMVTMNDFSDDGLLGLISRYQIDVPATIVGSTDDSMREFFQSVRVLRDEMKLDYERTGRVNFDEMLYYPVTLGMTGTQYDFIAVDEAQDFNRLQHDCLRTLGHKGTQYLIVGDPDQSIMLFAMADSNSFARLTEMFEAKVYPMSLTYRCPDSVVEYVNKHFPYIAFEGTGKVEGRVVHGQNDQVIDLIQPTNLVVCRFNAPLFKYCIKAIALGKPSYIRGKDIQFKLQALCERALEHTGVGFDQVIFALEQFETDEMARLIKNGKEMAAEDLRDNVESLKTIIVECDINSIDHLGRKIKQLQGFGSDGKRPENIDELATIFTTIHKVKGDQANRVIVIDYGKEAKSTNMEQLQQEQNLKFVAVTRTKDELFLLTKKGAMFVEEVEEVEVQTEIDELFGTDEVSDSDELEEIEDEIEACLRKARDMVQITGLSASNIDEFQELLQKAINRSEDLR